MKATLNLSEIALRWVVDSDERRLWWKETRKILKAVCNGGPSPLVIDHPRCPLCKKLIAEKTMRVHIEQWHQPPPHWKPANKKQAREKAVNGIASPRNVANP